MGEEVARLKELVSVNEQRIIEASNLVKLKDTELANMAMELRIIEKSILIREILLKKRDEKDLPSWTALEKKYLSERLGFVSVEALPEASKDVDGVF